MQFISGAVNKVKDGYLFAIDWIEGHPHLTLWAGVVVMICALVFA